MTLNACTSRLWLKCALLLLSFAHLQLSAVDWNVDANGNWGTNGNWSAAHPNAQDAVANFGNIITADRTVTLDASKTVGSITIDDGNNYTIQDNGGGETLTFDVSAGNAVITVSSSNGNGAHTISAGLSLTADNVDITNNSSGNLTLSGNFTGTNDVNFAGTGTTVMTGSGSTWTGDTRVKSGTLEINSGANISANALFIVGDAAADNGTTTISGGADVTATTHVRLGVSDTSTGTATVTGSGSTLNADNDIFIGDDGNGTLNVLSGGDIDATEQIYIGEQAGSVGVLTVNGSGSTATAGQQIVVANGGTGTLNVEAGAVVTSTNHEVQIGSGGTGTVTVTGSSSSLTAPNEDLKVGESSTGSLTVSNGGSVSASRIFVSNQSGSDGDMTVTGTNSTATSTGDFYVAKREDATLDITSGGGVTVGGDLLLSNDSGTGANGIVTISGASSTLAVSGSITSGSANAATVNADGGTITTDSFNGSNTTSNLELNGGTIRAGAASGTFINNRWNIKVQSGGAVFDTNAFNITVAEQLAEDAGDTGGGLTKNGTGTLTLSDTANDYTGGTTVNAGTLEITGRLYDAVAPGDVTIAGGTLLADTPDIFQTATSNPNLVLSGGTLQFGSSFDSDTNGQFNFNNLTLTANSILDFGSSNAEIRFNGTTVTGLDSNQLIVHNWSGVVETGGGSDQLFFTDTLTTTEQYNVLFYSDAGSTFLGRGLQLGTDEVVPDPVPEASTWISLLGAMLLSVRQIYKRRKR